VIKINKLQSSVRFGYESGDGSDFVESRRFACPKRCGYVFPMILFATLAVGLFIVTLTQFQSSTRLKYQHLNDYQSAFNIAYSALVEILADIQKKQWSNRVFKAGPVDRSAALFGGNFELRVSDHATLEHTFNTRIRVTYKNKRYLFYWRLKYNPSLLDFTQLFVPVYYEDFANPDNLPFNPDDIDSVVDQKIKDREDNQPKVDEIAKKVKTSPSIEEALKKVGIDNEQVKSSGEQRPPAAVVSLPKADLPLKELAMLVEDVAPNVTPVIKELRFGGDVAALTDAQKLLLDNLAEILTARPDMKIELRGHATGVVGTVEGNMLISIERAQNVANYLESLGISADRMTVKGLGQSQPIASNETFEGRARNRRVEFVFKETAD